MNKQIQAYECTLHGYDNVLTDNVLTDNVQINRASYFKGKSFPWKLRKSHITQINTV
jgi:hypothetical protein